MILALWVSLSTSALTSTLSGIISFQRLLGVAVDGMVGPVTLEALNAHDPHKIFNTIMEARVQFIDDICRRTPTNERFRRGWMNRLNDIHFEG